MLFGLLAWTFPPGVNEAHYLSKAKYFWDRGFCPADLFVTSHEAHWLFYVTHGWLCRFLEFESVAWIGRGAAWLVTAWGFVLLSRSFQPIRGVAILAGGLVVVLNLYLNLAGEWFVGGVEGKCYAYGFAFAGLAMWSRQRPQSTWICLGIACAFHIVVGLWLLIAATFAWGVERAMTPSQPESSATIHRGFQKSTVLAAVVALLFVGVGLWPALSQNIGTGQAIVVEASKIQSLGRLAHHQLATGFDRWHLFAPLILAWAVLWRTNHTDGGRKLVRMNLLVLASLLISLCGIVLSLVATNMDEGTVRDISARILTLYLFRLADVLVPVGVVINGMQFIAALPGPVTVARPLAIATGLFLVASVVLTFKVRLDDPRTGSTRQSVAMPEDEALRTREIEAERNWIRTCHWIRGNTPEEAVFITPPSQQTFKWYAHRGEACCRKDMPQDASSVITWRNRMGLLYFGDSGPWKQQGVEFGFETQELVTPFLPLGFRDHLVEVAGVVSAQYLVVEQRLVDEFLLYFELPSCLTKIYPEPGQRKSTFVVYRIGGIESQ